MTQDLRVLKDLLEEVRRSCTRDDDLPDGLLQRIDAALDGETPYGTLCWVCGEHQHNTPSGVSCPNGHGGADSI